MLLLYVLMGVWWCVSRCRPNRAFCRLGDLATHVGWKHDALVQVCKAPVGSGVNMKKFCNVPITVDCGGIVVRSPLPTCSDWRRTERPVPMLSTRRRKRRPDCVPRLPRQLMHRCVLSLNRESHDST